MYDCFGLVLMVTHRCNLRCSYCYMGAKSARRMSRRVGVSALDRAIRSVHPGGALELCFFGGEPLLDADLILDLIQHARSAAADADVRLKLNLTTNGTVSTPSAWQLMMLPDLHLTVSHDGLPDVHDRHRLTSGGHGSSSRVMATIGRLHEAQRDVQVIMVVRPDTVALMPEGIAWLRDRGIRHIAPSLDLWTQWSQADAAELERALVRCADLWLAGLPDYSLSWFDAKMASLTNLPMNKTARCGFGDGEIAVAPSGNLYPCERLIGEDTPDNRMRLPGHTLDGHDFCRSPASQPSRTACSDCAIQQQCSTTCRCSNYVRTGDPDRPDGLLCLLDKVCHRETARVLRQLEVVPLSDEECEAPCAATVP